MKLEEQKHIQGTSPEDEEKHLKETLDVIHANMDSYGRQVQEMKANIDEMLEHYHDNDAEVYVILCNTITMHEHMKRALERNERAAAKPYFGRICFHDEGSDREESIYIGKGGISRDSTHQEVIDWRAPMANAYYENGLGKCSYPSPEGTPIWIDLKLKRTYEIDQGKRIRGREESLFFQTKSRSFTLIKSEILYVENCRRKVDIHTLNQTESIYATMAHMEELLGDGFFRCHRGYLVNMAHIARYSADSILLHNGETIYLSKEKYNDFAAAYMNYLKQGGVSCV